MNRSFNPPDKIITLSNILIQQHIKPNKRNKIKNCKKEGRTNEPARVPLAAARLRPFFFKMKLEPMNTLDATANTKPISLSDTISFFFFIRSKLLSLFLISMGTTSNRDQSSVPGCCYRIVFDQQKKEPALKREGKGYAGKREKGRGTRITT